jgi:hypothetical protein
MNFTGSNDPAKNGRSAAAPPFTNGTTGLADHTDHRSHVAKAFWLRDLVNLTFAKRA